MKQKLILIPFLFLFGFEAQAQFNKAATGSTDVVKKPTPSQLILQLTNGINPGSFAGSFSKEKKSFENKISTATSPVEFSKNTVLLAGYIKPEMYKAGYSAANLSTKTSSVKTMQQAVEILKKLESNLKPESFSPAWKLQKSGWESELNNLK